VPLCVYIAIQLPKLQKCRNKVELLSWVISFVLDVSAGRHDMRAHCSFYWKQRRHEGTHKV